MPKKIEFILLPCIPVRYKESSTHHTTFKMSKRYNVTINFNFRYQDPRDDWDYESEGEDEYEGSDVDAEGQAAPVEPKPKPKPKTESQRKREAFARTDEYFRTHSLMDHIKSNDAFGFVEYLTCSAEVLSAEWDSEKFQIHMVVETDQTPEELIDDLRSNSLEDGEYEACGDTGWLVMTRGPNGECFGPPWDMEDFWLYGDTDYRDNEIEVTEIVEAEPQPEPKATVGATILAN